VQFSICLIQPPEYVHSEALREAAELLDFSARSLGFSSRVRSNELQPGALNVVLGYHLLAEAHIEKLAAHPCIIYQLEQLSEHEGWFTEQRERLLRAAGHVWDYSADNVAFLQGRGIDRASLLPLGYHPKLRRIDHWPEEKKDIDVLFYGGRNERRIRILRRLYPRCRLHALFGVYGAERDRWIARARTVLNMHYYDAQVLEQVRLSYLLNNECFVVSELSAENPYGGGLVLCPYEELAKRCLYYLKRPAARRRVAARGLEILRKRPMTQCLEWALEALPDALLRAAGAAGEPEAALSWPEGYRVRKAAQDG